MFFMFMKSPKLDRASFQHSMTYGYSKYLEEQLLPQRLLINHLISQVILSLTDIKINPDSRTSNYFDNRSFGGAVKDHFVPN